MKKLIVVSAVVIAGLFLLGILHYKKDTGNFNTLSEAIAFANNANEYPEIDNEDWWDPDFSSFYRTKDPGLFTGFLNLVGIRKRGWSINSFTALLNSVTKERENSGYFGEFIEKMTPKENKKFIIWGNVQGAFHSLVRDLQELVMLGTLSNDLQIIDQDYFFIFTGNVIDRSSYSMETLTLVLQLLKKNPEKVFYLRGTHEDKEMWHNFGLKRELAIRASGKEVDMGIPYGKSFRKFFNTLPLALYLIGDRNDNGVDVVRVTNKNALASKLNENNYAGFLYDEQKELDSIGLFKLSEISTSNKKVRVGAIIKSNNVNQKYYRNDGLRLLLPEKESTTWSVLSAPTGTYRRLFGFFYDAFTVLNIKKELKDWTLSLYGQDVREMTGFELRRTVGLISGAHVNGKSGEINKLGAGDETIVIGSTMDLSRGLQQMSEQLREGLTMPLKEQNEAGGISNRRITLVVKDDFYVPSKARKNIETFLAEDVSIILSPQGTPTIASYLDLIEKKKLLVLFPVSGKQDILLNYLIRFRPSYETEGRVLTEYALNSLRVKRISFFYQNDHFGLGALAGARKALKAKGVVDFNEVGYESNDLEFADQVSQIKKFDQDSIIFFGIPTAVEELIRQIGVDSIAHDRLLGISDLGSSAFNNFLEEKGLSMVVPSVVPNPTTATLPIVEQYRVVFDALQLPYNSISLEGYICSSILVKVLKKVAYPFSLAEIVTELEGIKNYSLGGFPLDFNSNTRELSNNLWLHTIPGSDKEPWDQYDISNNQLIRAEKSL